MDFRRKGRECEDGNFTHPGLGHKPQYKNNLRLDVWALSGPVRTGSPHSLMASSSRISCHPPLPFLRSFIQFLPQGRRCFFLCRSPSPLPTLSPKARPSAPTSVPSVLKPCLSFPWACRACASLLRDPSPLALSQVLIPPCVHASVLLLPKFIFFLHFPHASSLSVASNRGQEVAGASPAYPSPVVSLKAPWTVCSWLFGEAGASWGLTEASCSCGPRPFAASPSACWAVYAQAPPPPSLEPASPHPHPRAREQEQNIT